MTRAGAGGWRASFWVASAAFGATLLVLRVLLRRHVLIRCMKERTLRFLAAAVETRESDPAMRELVTTTADPDDADAIENVTDFFADHPDLRVKPRRDVLREEPPRASLRRRSEPARCLTARDARWSGC